MLIIYYPLHYCIEKTATLHMFKSSQRRRLLTTHNTLIMTSLDCVHQLNQQAGRDLSLWKSHLSRPQVDKCHKEEVPKTLDRSYAAKCLESTTETVSLPLPQLSSRASSAANTKNKKLVSFSSTVQAVEYDNEATPKTLSYSYTKWCLEEMLLSTDDVIVSPPSPAKRSSSSSSDKPSVVSFSTVQVVEYEPPSINRNQLFYTEAEYALMKLQQQSDIYFLHHGGRFNVDPTGLETYVSEHIRDKTIRQKRKYVDSVMEEYKRQCKCGISDPILLSCIARDSSKWCMHRAMKVGSYQSKSSQRTFASCAA